MHLIRRFLCLFVCSHQATTESPTAADVVFPFEDIPFTDRSDHRDPDIIRFKFTFVHIRYAQIRRPADACELWFLAHQIECRESGFSENSIYFILKNDMFVAEDTYSYQI